MKKIAFISISIAVALGALACSQEAGQGGASKAPEADKPAAAPAAAPAAEPAPAAPAAVDQTGAAAAADPAAADVTPEAAAVPEEVPTAEDFEEKVAADVDKKNLETEVTRLEKELGVKDKDKGTAKAKAK
jgi:hypothetical protein